MSSRLDALQQKIIELQEELASLRRSEYIARAGTARALDTQFPDALLHLPFDGGAPYERDFSVNLYGHKLQRPTVASGGIIGRPGKFGKAVQLAEATTNHVKNPSFEISATAQYSTSGSGTIERDTSRARFGSASCKITAGSDTTRILTGDTFPLANGQTVTATVWVYKDAAKTTTLRVSDNWSHVQSAIDTDTVGRWFRLVHTYTNNTGATMNIRLSAENAAQDSATAMWFDGFQGEVKAYPTPYCDGSLGPGHAWTGTPHASTSTRVAAHLGYGPQPGVDDPRGCYAFWFMPFANSGTWPTNTRLVQAGNASSAPYCAVYCDDSGNTLRAYRMGDGAAVCTAPIAWAAMEWHHIVFCWDNGTSRLFIDGVLASEQPCGVDIQTSDFYVGSWYNAGRQCNGYIDDLLILDRALTPTEVRRLYEAGQAGYPVVCPQLPPTYDGPVTATVSQSEAETLSTGTTYLTFGTVDEETRPAGTESQWSASDPTKLICRVPGYYIVTGSVLVPSVGSPPVWRQAIISATIGGVVNQIHHFGPRTAGVTGIHAFVAEARVWLNVGDDVRLIGRISGGTEDTYVSDTLRPTLSWVRVS